MALHNRLQVEWGGFIPMEWNGVECALFSDLKKQSSAHCLFPRYRYTQSFPPPSYPPSLPHVELGKEPDLLTGG